MLISKRSTWTAQLFVRFSMGRAAKKGAQAFGRSRGELTADIGLCVGGPAQLVTRISSAGRMRGVAKASALSADIELQAAVAGKAYDADPILLRIAAQQAHAVIPPETSRKVQHPLEWRSDCSQRVTTPFFVRIRQFRRVAGYQDKPALRFVLRTARLPASAPPPLRRRLLWLCRGCPDTGHTPDGQSRRAGMPAVVANGCLSTFEAQ